MTTSEITAQCTFTNGQQMVYNVDSTDGSTEQELLELISGSGIGTASQGLVLSSMQIQCENQVEYVVLLDELGQIQFSTGGCDAESIPPATQTVPGGRAIMLNYALKCITSAS